MRRRCDARCDLGVGSYSEHEMATSHTRTITARDLKNHTGDAIRAAREGRRTIVTYRGRPVAVIVPAEPSAERESGSYEVEWAEVAAALASTSPPERTWQEAMARSRRRP